MGKNGEIRFRGFFRHALDERNRLAIPSLFRNIINQESSGKLVLTPGYDREISIYALKTWKKFENTELLTLSMDHLQSRRYRRHFTFGIKEDKLDTQGRILIPEFLLEHSGIKKDVIIVGEISYFTLWSSENYEKFREDVYKNYLNDAEGIENLRRRHETTNH